MITTDTWAVISADKDHITLECPFQEGNPWIVSVEWFGFDKEHDFHVGDIFSTETGGVDYLQYEELEDITEEGRKFFFMPTSRKKVFITHFLKSMDLLLIHDKFKFVGMIVET